MKSIEESIEVNVPVTAAYNQWTQFESFPMFMEGIKEVRQLDDKRLFWRAEVAGRDKEWEAEIFEQVPDTRIAWRSMEGTKNSGMVNFAPVTASRCRVSLKLNYDTEGLLENLGDAFGVLQVRVQGDLRRFKDYVETRRKAPEGWRGEIRGKKVEAEPEVSGPAL